MEGYVLFYFFSVLCCYKEFVVFQGSEEEVKKLKEQVEMTLNKLEESKNLLKTNENGK